MTARAHPIADVELDRHYDRDEHDQALHQFHNVVPARVARDQPATPLGGAEAGELAEGHPPVPGMGSAHHPSPGARAPRHEPADRHDPWVDVAAPVPGHTFADDIQRALTLVRQAEETVPTMHPNVELLVGTDLQGARTRLGAVLAHLRREGIAA